MKNCRVYLSFSKGCTNSISLRHFTDSASLVCAVSLAGVSMISLYFNIKQYYIIQKLRLDDSRMLARETALNYKEEMLKESNQMALQSFENIAQSALLANNESFLHVAKSAIADLHDRAKSDMESKSSHIKFVIAPLQRSLEQVESKMELLEKERASSVTDLRRQVVDLIASQNLLRLETSNLVKALRTPTGRGQWGEMQLR